MKSLKQIKEEYLDKLSFRYTNKEIDTIFYALAETFLHKEKMQIKLGIEELQEESDIKNILFQNALFRLMEGTPYQYVIGNTLFYDCEIMVNPNVLIPRPETEELVEWILKDIIDKNRVYNIIDLCSGSGCIGIAIAKKLTQSKISALEISKEAIDLSQKNAKLNHTDINFIQADLLNFQTIQPTEKFDIIVSNPPYIRDSEKNTMEENVLKFEPEKALFVSDQDPLIFYNKIIEFSFQNLNKKGKVYVEINQELAEQTKKLFLEYFSLVELKQDLSGNFRMIKAEGII